MDEILQQIDRLFAEDAIPLDQSGRLGRMAGILVRFDPCLLFLADHAGSTDRGARREPGATTWPISRPWARKWPAFSLIRRSMFIGSKKVTLPCWPSVNGCPMRTRRSWAACCAPRRARSGNLRTSNRCWTPAVPGLGGVRRDDEIAHLATRIRHSDRRAGHHQGRHTGHPWPR